jgi:hypothetical protein
MSATGLVLGTFIFAPALAFGLNAGDVPPQNYFAANTHVELLYKENGQILVYPIMVTDESLRACPNGDQVARANTRVEGAREYLVWDLRCR